MGLLDAIDAFKRELIQQDTFWRVCREGRDPLAGGPSRSRWCNDTFDVLYTSFERDGALAEIYALLSSQPVFPSKIRSFAHKVSIRTGKTLRLCYSDLQRLGIDLAAYKERDYSKTQAIADAAYFLGFDSLLAPSPRWECLNLVVFTDRIGPENVKLVGTDREAVDWVTWKRSVIRRPVR